MLNLIIITAIVLAIALFFMAIRIIIDKKHKFPRSSVGHNKHLRKKGIKCAQSEERAVRMQYIVKKPTK